MKRQLKGWSAGSAADRSVADRIFGAGGWRPGQRISFTWYRKEQWPRLRELASDPQALDDSHAEWLKTAEQTVATLRRLGVAVRKVFVDLEAAQAWSREQGRPFDSAARASYVAAMASRERAGARRRTTGCS